MTLTEIILLVNLACQPTQSACKKVVYECLRYGNQTMVNKTIEKCVLSKLK